MNDPNVALRGGLAKLLEAKTVAVVGASGKRGVHRAAIENLTANGATAWGVHPRREEILGIPCFRSVSALPQPPDMAMLLVGHRNLHRAAADAIAGGARSLIIPGLGREAGEEAAPIARAIGDLASSGGVPVIGPNCMGVAVPGGTSAWVGTLGQGLRPGRIATVVQSGSIGEALAALGDRVGLRCIFSLGAEQNRDVADVLNHLAEDRQTEAVGIFLESIRRPRAFRQALLNLQAAGKPVVCLRVGRSDAGTRATIAHTDAVLTPTRAFRAIAREAELIEAEDFSEFVEALAAFDTGTPPRGGRVATVTQSGGEAALWADLAADNHAPMRPFSDRLGRELGRILGSDAIACNPLDAWAIDETVFIYRQVFEQIADSGEYDILAVQMDQSPFVGEIERRVSLEVCTALAELGPDRVYRVIVSGQATEPVPEVAALAARHEIPLLRGSNAPIAALSKIGRRASRTQRWDAFRESGPPPRNHHLGEFKASQDLARQGIPFPRMRLANTPREAVEAALEIGFPVVLKANEVAHRSASNEITLGLRTPAGVEAEFIGLNQPALVVEQVPRGLEVYCGGRNDPDYGPIVCVGWGGQTLEQRDNVVCAPASLDLANALALVDSIPGLPTSTPPASLEAFADIVIRLGDFLEKSSTGTTVDLNPIVLIPSGGAVAVDALVTPGAS